MISYLYCISFMKKMSGDGNSHDILYWILYLFEMVKILC